MVPGLFAAGHADECVDRAWPSGLAGAARLARGRADGAVLVPGDRRTAARSFWAIAFCLPSVLCRLLMAWAGTGFPTDPGHQIGRELITFVLGWLLSSRRRHAIAPLLGRARHGRVSLRCGTGAMWWRACCRRWWHCPTLLGAPPVIGQAARLITIGWALWLEWYATRAGRFGVRAVAADRRSAAAGCVRCSIRSHRDRTAGVGCGATVIRSR